MKPASIFIPAICILIASLSGLILAVDTGTFYNEQLYNKDFSSLQLGYLVAILIEAMIALSFFLSADPMSLT
jgi:hypothetical protein